MAEAKKNEVVETGKQQAGLVVNNAFVDGLVSQLQAKEKFGLTFPKDYNYNNELMGAYLILKETNDKDGKPVLQSCSQVSIANTLMDMVTLGVSMQKKQCYPVAYGGKLQCQISVFGNTCIARRFGLKEVNALCIYEGDTVNYRIEDGKRIIESHTQDFMNIDNDKIKGAYAVVIMNDGSQYTEIMNMSMIKQAWKQGFGYKEGGNGTHQKFTDQMCMKTVTNRALKYIIRTHSTQVESDAYDNFEESEFTDKVVENVQYDIQANANTVDFDVEEEKAPEKVEGEVVTDSDMPEFMKQDQ